MSLNMTGPAIASRLGISLRTLYRRMSTFGLSISATYSTMSDEELDRFILRIKDSDTSCGSGRMMGYLKSSGFRVQRTRVRQRMRAVDGPGVMQRRLELRWIRRRGYNVAGPNSLWHIDGHHKLIRWKIVTHGGIDGFSRMVTFLHASCNNRAETVLTLFQDAVMLYGMPDKVRSDRGGENVLVADFVLERQGPNSFIAGRSVHNQRIERLWRDVHCDVTQLFYNHFYGMEEDEILNPDNDTHVAILHYCFLQHLNKNLSNWAESWNSHSIRTAHHQTPQQMFLTADRSESAEDDGIDWDVAVGDMSVDEQSDVIVLNLDDIPPDVRQRMESTDPTHLSSLQQCEAEYMFILGL